MGQKHSFPYFEHGEIVLTLNSNILAEVNNFKALFISTKEENLGQEAFF